MKTLFGKRLVVIAEIAGGHMGSPDRCLDLVEAAIRAKADAVKFQFYKADELCNKDHADYTLFKKLEFGMETWRRIFSRLREAGLSICADIFGPESFNEALSLGVDAFKLHAADLDNRDLVEQVARSKRPILLGVGGHKRIEIYRTVQRIRSISPESLIVFMPGHQLFPTPVAEHCLEEIRWFSEAYADLGVIVGCADHVDGGDPLAALFPLAAIGAGAVVIEKHLTIDRRERWEDYESAIEPEDFRKMVAFVRGLEPVSRDFPVWTPGRQRYREKAIKTYVTAREIPSDTNVGPENLKFIRPTQFSNPLPSDLVSHRRTIKPLGENRSVNGLDIRQNVGILINCRTQSMRLPQKALKKICGKETIALLIERMKQCTRTNQIILCTTERPEDNVLVDIAGREGIPVFRGPDENVALRLLLAGQKHHLDHVVRVTGDDLLRDLPLIDQAIESHLKNHADYTAMTGVVYSCDTEIISLRALETIVQRARCPENTEYLTWYLDDESAFVVNKIEASSEYRRDYRLTLDTEEDLALFNALHEALYRPGKPVDLREALHYMDRHPELAKVNAHIRPKLSRSELDTSLRI